MQPGVPIEVDRGYCVARTVYKQDGEPINRDDMMENLAKHEPSRPHLVAGNWYALGSIVAVASAFTAFIVGTAGRHDRIDEGDDAANGLLIGGLAASAASWGLCIASDAEYATAAESYQTGEVNAEDADRTYETPEFTD